MRLVIAVVVCLVEIAAFGIVLALLGSSDIAKESAPFGGILAIALLALILGATWCGITKQAFPRALLEKIATGLFFVLLGFVLISGAFESRYNTRYTKPTIQEQSQLEIAACRHAQERLKAGDKEPKLLLLRKRLNSARVNAEFEGGVEARERCNAIESEIANLLKGPDSIAVEKEWKRWLETAPKTKDSLRSFSTKRSDKRPVTDGTSLD